MAETGRQQDNVAGHQSPRWLPVHLKPYQPRGHGVEGRRPPNNPLAVLGAGGLLLLRRKRYSGCPNSSRSKLMSELSGVT